MKFTVLTLFPEQVKNFLSQSILGRAMDAGIISVDAVDIREYSDNRYGKVDDTLFGGGTGMLMQCEPVDMAFASLYDEKTEPKPHCIFMSPKGRVFTERIAQELTQYDHIVLLCGHYEGIDQRVLDKIVDEDLSIGDYVLTGGEVASCVIIDAVSRLISGVLPDESAFSEESHMQGYLEAPQYTKPSTWQGKKVPDVLLSGHHANIVEWKRIHGLYDTWKRRPDMLDRYPMTEKDWEALFAIDEEKNASYD